MNKYKKIIFTGLIALAFTTPNHAISANLTGNEINSNNNYNHILLTGISASKSKEISDASKDVISNGAQNFVQGMAQRALDFLAMENKTTDEKEALFKNLLNDNFDMNTIGRFALGKYWRSTTKAEKKEYLDLFNQMIIGVYSQRFSEYKGQNLKTKKSRMTNKRDTLVSSTITSNNSSKGIKVDWMVRYKNDKYKIVDVRVEGISMAITQRQDFSSVIQRGGGKISVLIDHLRINKKNKKDKKDKKAKEEE